MRAKYVNISIREDLAKQVDKLIKKSKLGFPSRASLVSYLLRRYLEEGKKVNYKGYV